MRKLAANSARSLLRAAGFRAVTRTIRGGPMRIPVAMGELRSLLFDRSYSPFFNEDDVMDLLDEKIRPEDVVFDIGAYHGVWSMLLARRARKVVAFEPNPATFAVLQEMIAVNNARSVIPFRLAIGSEHGRIDLWGTGSGASLRQGRFRPSRRRVNVETLDSFAHARSLLPDIVKIDVEGAEYQVLRGAARCLAHARVVCIELHFDELPKFGADVTMVESLMAGSGFVEVGRTQPVLAGGAGDPSRLHIVYERRPDKPERAAIESF